MQRLLIILGLIVIPFYEIFLHMLPFVHGVAPDSRVPKEMLALVFSLSIGLLAVWHGSIKPFRNKFFLIIPVYLLFNLLMSPHVNLNINNNEVGDFYFWKPFSEVLCFTLMIIAIASLEININELLKVMVICGTIMSIYVILQKFGIDQFWSLKTEGQFTSVRAQALGGNLGQPTIVSSWIVMIIPLAMYLKKYWMVGIMTISCLLTQGAMVIMALGFIWLISMGYSYRELIKPIIILCIVIGMFGSFQIFRNENLRNKIIDRMDGRYEVWKNTVSDIKNGQIDDLHKFPLTGIGLGRFSFTFPIRHHSEFHQTHNDFLEFTYNCGMIGSYLLLAGIVSMIILSFHNLTPIVFSILLSFIALFICSLGSFPFQLGAHQFYAAILVGLLHNDSLIRRIT